MKTVLLLALFLYAASAAPTEDKQEAPEAVAVTVVDAPEEQMAAAPGQEEEAAPEARFNPCPDGWYHHGGRCFMLVTTPMNWKNAQEHCNGLGGHLASVTNPTEYSFLQDITHAVRRNTAWLGGFRLGGNWMWIDSRGFYYTNWYSQWTPFTSYPCIYLNTNYGWGNQQCSSSLYFICSKNPYGC